MNILIIGGAGVVARKLARALADKGTLRGKDISKLTLADIGEAETVDAPFPVETAQCDITDPASVAKIITEETVSAGRLNRSAYSTQMTDPGKHY